MVQGSLLRVRGAEIGRRRRNVIYSILGFIGVWGIRIWRLGFGVLGLGFRV
jgi:hypothetical protein